MIVAQVRRTLAIRQLLPVGASVLLGLSGGPDSGAMLVVLSRLSRELRLRLRAASVDHGLRPQAADDVRLACAQAQALEVPCAPLSLQLRPGAQLQARARKARYRALLAEARRVGAEFVAVGHTLDDQAETVLMRQLRGCGLRGLAGIAPRRDDGVVRPLLDCRRELVHRFAHQHLPMCAQDPSNQDLTFARVRVRTRLLPALLREDPQAREHLAHLADEARQVIAWQEQRAAEALDKLEKEPKVLELDSLRAVSPELLPVVFRGWLRAHGLPNPSRAHLQQLLACLGGRGEVWLRRGYRARVEGGQRLRLVTEAALE